MLDPGQHRPDLWQQPFLHVNHAGKQASQPFSRESDGSIFIYNLLIIMLATIFFPKKKNGNEMSTTMCLNQSSVSAGFYFEPRLGSAVGTERNLINLVDLKRD